MRKRALLLAIALSGLFGIAPALSSQELLTNPSFEEGTNAVPWNDTIPPTTWQKYGNWGWAGWKNNRPAHTGTKYVDAGAWNYGQYGVWYQDIIVRLGESYICSIWVKTEGGGWETDPHASMMMEFRDASNKVLTTDRLDIFTGTPPSPNDWKRYLLTTRPAPAGTTYARFLLRGEARCTAMFDDASVIPATAQSNPDFNNDGLVNFRDYAKLAQAWRCDSGNPQSATYDLDNNGTVGTGDLEILARRWLVYDEYVTIDIDPSVTFQQMDGFGASLTDSSAHLIYNALTKQQRQALTKDLFDPNTGIGLSYLRQPMGSSDFRLTDYTYDDMPAGKTDYDLRDFSIAHDRNFIIPLLQEALAINPNIKIMGSPWSAPAWMKDGGQLGYGRLVDSDRIYDTYAAYFVRYIQAYAAEGLTIDAVTLQNEPHYEPYSYPGMRMEPPDQVRLAIRLGQKFQANDIHTKIVVWDHNWDNPGYPIAVLNDPQANPYIAGTAFHAYAGGVSAQLDVVKAHPDKDIYFTESSGGDWAPSFGDNLMWDTSTLIIKSVRYYAKTVAKWNLALDENHGPKSPGGCGNCRGVVTIDQSTGQVVKEVEYYSLGHAAKFVRPGARHIASTEQPGQNIENVAFVNPDGSTVAIVLNPNTFRQNAQLKWKGQSFIYGLPGRSVTTFKWPDEPNATVEVWMTTADQTRLLNRQSAIDFRLAIPIPMAYWSLDETAGSIAHDVIGNNDGTLSGGPIWRPTDGKAKGAVQFDGVDDYVSTPFILNPHTGPFSVFAWVKTISPARAVISQTATVGFGRSWLCTDASGNLMTELKASGRGGFPLVSQAVITDDQWHRVGFAWDGAYRTLYVDGTEVAKDSTPQQPLETANGGLYIGAANNLAAGTFWSGLIDDVRVYDRAVTS